MNRSLDKELRIKLDEAGNNNIPITNTMRWEYSIYRRGFGDTHDFFYSTPPIKSALQSNRILVTGTNCDIDRLSRKPSRLLKKVIKDKVEREKIIKNNPEFTYCSEVRRFWSSFFGEDNFLDGNEITTPYTIISTGKMRNYLMICGAPRGENLDVSDRLKEIAKNSGIYLYFIK